MKNFLLCLVFGLIFCTNAFSEIYHFKGCKLSESLIGNYIINLEKKIIKVSLKTFSGEQQELEDKIKEVRPNRVISEKIKSRTGDDLYFQYFFDAEAMTVSKMQYRKQDDFFKIDGAITKSFCVDVKADWEKDKKATEHAKQLEEEQKKKKEEEVKRKILELKSKEAREEAEKEKNKFRISINSDKWVKLSKAKADDSRDYLKNKFNEEAKQICSSTGSFKILAQNIKVVEIDDTPAWGNEPAVQMGISGTIECVNQ